MIWFLGTDKTNKIKMNHIKTMLCGNSEDNRIPAANQEISLEVHFSDREDHQNFEKRGDKAFGNIITEMSITTQNLIKSHPA